MSRNTLCLLIGLSLVQMVACSKPEPEPDMEPPTPTPDLSMVRDMSMPPPSPDLLARCELPYDVRNIDKVSTGLVTVMQSPSDPMVFTAEVDATAGGSMKYGENPFLYLDLVGRKKLDITDVQAPNQGGWDIALKRWQIKVNSGDSGNGGVTAARVDGKVLADVTKAPMGPYEADSYFDAKCTFQADPIGGLGTTLSDWYDYESGTSRIVPKKEVIVLKRRDGQGHIKLQILSYYKGTTSANYTLTWSYLP